MAEQSHSLRRKPASAPIQSSGNHARGRSAIAPYMGIRKDSTVPKAVQDPIGKEWRRLFRAYNEAEDGILSFNEFIRAVRNGETARRLGIADNSDKELKELWCTIDQQVTGSANIEDLVNYLISEGSTSYVNQNAEDSLVEFATSQKESRRSRSPPKSPSSGQSLAIKSPHQSNSNGVAHQRPAPQSISGSFAASPSGAHRSSTSASVASEPTRPDRAFMDIHLVHEVLNENEALRSKLFEASGLVEERDAQIASLTEENGRLLHCLATEERLKEDAVEQAQRSGATVKVLESSLKELRQESIGNKTDAEKWEQKFQAETDNWEKKHQTDTESWEKKYNDLVLEARQVAESSEEARLTLQMECEARLKAEKQALEQAQDASEWSKRAADLEEEVAVRGATIKDLQEQLDQANDRKALLDSQIQNLEVRLESTKGSLNIQMQLRGEAERTCESSEHARREVEMLLQGSEEKVVSLSSALSTASEAIAQLREELQKLRSKLKIAEENQNKQADRIQTLEEAHEFVVADCNHKDSERKGLEAEFNTFRKESEATLQEANDRLQELGERVLEDRVRKEEADDRAKELKQQALALTKQNGALGEELDTAKEAANELREEMETLIQNLSDQRASNLQVVKENRTLLVEVRAHQERCAGLLKLLQGEEDARKRLQSRLADCEQDLQRAGEEMGRKEERMGHERQIQQELKQEVQKLVSESGSKSNSVALLREEHEMTKQKLQQASSEVAGLSKQVVDTKAQTDKVLSENRHLEEKLYYLQQRYSMELERSLQHSRAIVQPVSPSNSHTTRMQQTAPSTDSQQTFGLQWEPHSGGFSRLPAARRAEYLNLTPIYPYPPTGGEPRTGSRDLAASPVASPLGVM